MAKAMRNKMAMAKATKKARVVPSLTAEERQQIKDEIKEAMLAAAATVDGAGNLPAGVKRLIQELDRAQDELARTAPYAIGESQLRVTILG
jgi:hypothetical protein